MMMLLEPTAVQLKLHKKWWLHVKLLIETTKKGAMRYNFNHAVVFLNSEQD